MPKKRLQLVEGAHRTDDGRWTIDPDHLLPEWSGRTSLNEAEDVESYGLSPTEYIAVVEAELGWAGKVNRNRRIYPSQRFASENAGLNARAREQFVAAEKDHPAGLPTFNVAARIVQVEVQDGDGNTIELEQDESGAWLLPESAGEMPTVVHARGKLAFLRTEAGSDLWCCYRAGMPLGTSSRSFGIPVPHKLEADSPYLEDNQEFEGETIDLIEGQELITYDVVTVPSAGTYVQGNAGAAAFESLRESLGDAQHLEPRETLQEQTLKNREWLKENAPDLYAELVKFEQQAKGAEAITNNELAARVAKLGESESKRLQSLMGLVEGTGDKAVGDDALLKRIEEQISGPLRQRLTLAEEKAAAEEKERAKLAEQVKLLQAEKEAREKAEANQKALDEALVKVHKNLREAVAEFVQPDIDSGAIEGEAIGALVQRTAEAFAKVSKRTIEQAGDQPGQSADENADDGGDNAGGDEPATEEDVLFEAIIGPNGLNV